jgi:hypothetical protein
MSTINLPSIHVFAICYNEQRIIPFFLDHYKYADRITVYDNESTDNSKDILMTDSRVEIISYSTFNTLNDQAYIDIKQTCWKNTDCSYAIIVDMDEFVYHSNIKNFLRDTNQAAYIPQGYNMVSETFPEFGSFVSAIPNGVKDNNYSKLCILDTNRVDSIFYELGCHQARINMKNGTDAICEGEDIKLLHYKNISFDYRINKHQEYIKRMSEFNTTVGAGIHYTYSEEQQRMEFDTLLKDAYCVL